VPAAVLLLLQLLAASGHAPVNVTWFGYPS
jgi:hypothetical protein